MPHISSGWMVADKEDAVARQIPSEAVLSLAELGWRNREVGFQKSAADTAARNISMPPWNGT
jgi:hypothetical protein